MMSLRSRSTADEGVLSSSKIDSSISEMMSVAGGGFSLTVSSTFSCMFCREEEEEEMMMETTWENPEKSTNHLQVFHPRFRRCQTRARR